MPYRTTPFIVGEYYHIYNRGLEKQNIFISNRDYQRFIETMFYYPIANPKPKLSIYQQSSIYSINSNEKIVEIICYCLMPNHFHLLVKQLKEGGISEFMRRFIHSYTKYRNIKYGRQGPVFQGMFKVVMLETDEQFIHLSRYIHLNPYVAGLTKDLNTYPWSSYQDYIGPNNNFPLAKDELLKFFKSSKDYEQFVLDQKGYGQTLELLKHASLDR